MKFQIFKDRKGKARVRLVARNGRILMTSEAYSRKAKAVNMIRSVLHAFRTDDIKIEEVEK